MIRFVSQEREMLLSFQRFIAFTLNHNRLLLLRFFNLSFKAKCGSRTFRSNVLKLPLNDFEKRRQKIPSRLCKNEQASGEHKNKMLNSSCQCIITHAIDTWKYMMLLQQIPSHVMISLRYSVLNLQLHRSSNIAQKQNKTSSQPSIHPTNQALDIVCEIPKKQNFLTHFNTATT
jgi:hypothetical protein